MNPMMNEMPEEEDSDTDDLEDSNSNEEDIDIQDNDDQEDFDMNKISSDQKLVHEEMHKTNQAPTNEYQMDQQHYPKEEFEVNVKVEKKKEEEE